MKKGDILEGVIERVDYPNRGFAAVDDTHVIVKNGIPGQKVRFAVTKKRSGKYEGRILDVLEKSPLEERGPQCGIFPACGGCMYQTMPYQAQLAMKEDQIRRLLRPFIEEGEGNISDIWEGILAGPSEFEYRNKMEFSFGDAYKDGPLTLGLHKKGSSYDVLTAYNCRLVPQDFVRILNTVHQYFLDRSIPYYHKMQHTGYLRHLLLREGMNTGEILVHIVTTSQMHLDLRPLADLLCGMQLDGRIVGVLHIINDSLSDVVQSDRTIILRGRDWFSEELLGLHFRISSFSFFQPNSGAAEVLYSKVREYIGTAENQVVYDLYSGTGTIAQLAASSAKEVIGGEIVAEAVEAARRNAEMNHIDNCRFLCGDVLKTLDEVETKPDLIILDPPRDGIHPKALPKILSYGVSRIIYISCKATSLTRDLPFFLQAGYRIEKACCVDQFCQTMHVESCVLLKRVSNRKPDAEVQIV